MKPYYEDEYATVYHGDALEALAVLEPGCADAVLSDPPYGVDGSSGSINKARAKAVYAGDRPDTINEVQTVYVPAIVRALSLVGGRGAVTPGTPHAFEYPKPADMAAILQPRTHGLSKWGSATWQPVLLYGKDPRAGLTIKPLTFTSNGRSDAIGHPCPKANDVIAWLVGRVSVEGETLLDPFMGSGTTLVAAKNLGRKTIGIEIEERYCEVAAERLSQGVLPLEGGRMTLDLSHKPAAEREQDREPEPRWRDAAIQAENEALKDQNVRLAGKVSLLRQQADALRRFVDGDWASLIDTAQTLDCLPDSVHPADSVHEYEWKGDHGEDARYTYPARMALIGNIFRALEPETEE